MVLQRERVWTKKERWWVEALKSDLVYEIGPMSELYPTLPEPDAYDTIRKRFGDEAGRGGWCKLMMTHQMVEMMRDAVVLLHAPLNCNSCVRNFHSHLFSNWGHGFIHTPTTAIDKRQVVFGGEEELYEAIKAVDRDLRPKLIVIYLGCAPGLIQDDIPRVVDRAQAEVKAKLFWYPTSGYEVVDIGLTIEEVTQMWVKLMDPPERVDKNAANVVGSNREVYWKHARGVVGERPYPYPSDADELARYIEGLGLRVHRVLMGGDYDYLRTAPEAGVNTIACGTWGFPLAMAIERRFGTPYVREELPLGVEATSRWIRGLGEKTGREEEAEKLIYRETQEIEDVWERSKEAVRGKVAIVAGRGNRVGSYLRLCKELEMDVIYLPGSPEMRGINEACIKGKRVDWDYFLDYGFDPMVIWLKEGVERDQRLFYPKAIMAKLGLQEEEVVYMYPDMSIYSHHADPSRMTYVNSSVHLRRLPGYPTRAVGFKGTEGLCRDIIEAAKVSKRKEISPFFVRLYSR